MALLFRFLGASRYYVLLTKPRVVFLATITAFSAMVLEGSLLNAPLRFAAVLVGVISAAAAAGALNQYYDRDIDGLMERTRGKRPIPAGRIEPRNALWFGIVLGFVGLVLLSGAGNLTAALLALGSIAWYILIYTKWLKRRTPLNIVVGGAAGAVGPLIGWTAGAGKLGLEAWLMFLIIFLWTPIHFWALALYTKEQYALAHIPMLPVTSGTKITYLHLSFYTALLVPVTTYLGLTIGMNLFFLTATIVLGLILIAKVSTVWRKGSEASLRRLFSYSNLYLALVFALIPASRS